MEAAVQDQEGLLCDDSTYLNCYDHNKAGRCLASFANSADAAIEDVAQLVGGAAAAEVDEDGHQMALFWAPAVFRRNFDRN